MLENWQIMLAALEIYKFYGADLSVLSITSVIDSLYIILKEYERDGTIRLKPAVKIPTFVSVFKIKKVPKNAKHLAPDKI